MCLAELVVQCVKPSWWYSVFSRAGGTVYLAELVVQCLAELVVYMPRRRLTCGRQLAEATHSTSTATQKALMAASTVSD